MAGSTDADATDARKPLILVLTWILTLPTERRTQLAARFAYVRLYTLNVIALVSTTWHHALKDVLDSGIDIPSRIFNWERETFKSARLMGLAQVQSLVFPAHNCSEPEFQQCCGISEMMRRWCPRRPRSTCAPPLMSILTDGLGFILFVENWHHADYVPLRLHEGSLFGLRRSASMPRLRVRVRSREIAARDDSVIHDA